MQNIAPIPSAEGKARETGGRAHLWFIDYTRGVAIFSVFLVHAAWLSFGSYQFTPKLLLDRLIHFDFPQALLVIPALGWVGVPIFFVISGFCIHLSHAGSKETGYKKFFIRRFFRIYPPYAVTVLLFALLYSHNDLGAWQNAVNLTTHLLLVHNFDIVQIYSINASLWSVAVEVQLYLLYPLMLLIVRRLGWRNGLILLMAIEFLSVTIPSILFHLHLGKGWNYNVIYRLPFAYWFSWAIGAKIADDWMHGRPIFLGRFPLWIGPVLLLLAYFIPGFDRYQFSFAALSTAAVLATVLSHPADKWLSTFPFSKHLQQVGVVSYSVYLLHQPLLGWD